MSSINYVGIILYTRTIFKQVDCAKFVIFRMMALAQPGEKILTVFDWLVVLGDLISVYFDFFILYHMLKILANAKKITGHYFVLRTMAMI